MGVKDDFVIYKNVERSDFVSSDMLVNSMAIIQLLCEMYLKQKYKATG